MSDPLKPVLPGTPLLDVVTADRMNALSESARRERLSRERTTSGPTSQRFSDSITIFVRNDTGSTFPINTAVQIGDPIGPPSSSYEYWQRGRVYGGILPTAAGVIYGITEEPILASGVGRVVVAGIVPVTLTVTSSGDTYADTAASSGSLTTSTSGTARILWKESGTGAGKRGVVQLVRPSSSGGGSLIVTDGTATVNPTAQITITAPDNGVLVSQSGTTAELIFQQATETNAGLVSIDDQELAGIKLAEAWYSTDGFVLVSTPAIAGTVLYSCLPISGNIVQSAEGSGVEHIITGPFVRIAPQDTTTGGGDISTTTKLWLYELAAVLRAGAYDGLGTIGIEAYTITFSCTTLNLPTGSVAPAAVGWDEIDGGTW